MLRPRIIACLLIKDKGLVKTVNFKASRYIGDPINAVRIFNELLIDELIVADIDASRMGLEPDYKLIADLAAECRMPLCYGGGITTTAQAARIFETGVEKIALGSAAVYNPGLISAIAAQAGTQSVVAVLDIKKRWLGGYDTWIRNGTVNTRKDPVLLAKEFQEAGAGEILLNSIDRDGTRKGYDRDINDRVLAATHIPVTLLGGAGSLEDIGGLIAQNGAIGAAAGSLFVFKGIYQAVLIHYPSVADKDRLIAESMRSYTTK